MKIKICGIRRDCDVQYLNKGLPDYAGFVFAPSKRQVSLEQAIKLRTMMDERIISVGVFVNASIDDVVSCVEKGAIQVIQLHGDEDERYIRELRERVKSVIFKAVRAKNVECIREADSLSCDYLLIDAYHENMYGGTGETFSWEMIPKDLKHPFFLAGGLKESNILHAIHEVPCIGVDISGGVETNGYKDQEKIEQIVDMVRKGTRMEEK